MVDIIGNGMPMKLALFLAMILISGVIICGCSSPAPAPAIKTVRVAYLPIADYAPLFIAKEEGFFSRQGIDVELVKVPGTAAALPLVLNGDIAVFAGPLKTGLVNAVAKGEHVRIVADKGSVVPGSCTGYALMVRKDLFDKGIVTNVSDLKGRKIAVRDSDYDLYRALALGNLSRNDVDTVEMEFPTVIPAFRNGAIDAGLVAEPFLSQAVNSGSAVILVPAQEFIPENPFPLYYGPAFLDKDPELGRRFMVAYLQGVKQYNEGKTERNLAILGNYTHLDRDLLNQTCWWSIAADGDVPKKPVREYLDWMYANKKISQNMNEDQLFDMSYVTYANGVLRNTTSSG
jgi:ABC-type nitrate/sulfonate/bicarbonate transport system substrate-binding protein